MREVGIGGVAGFNSYIGGIPGGINSRGVITACYNTGTVTGAPGQYTGGVVGYKYPVSDVIITDCYWLDLSGVDSSSASAAVGVVGGTVTDVYAFGPGSAWPSGGLWDNPAYWGNLGSWNSGNYGRNSIFPKLAGE